jgi:hypothetical protein
MEFGLVFSGFPMGRPDKYYERKLKYSTVYSPTRVDIYGKSIPRESEFKCLDFRFP